MNKLPLGIIQTPAGHFVLERDSHLSRWVEEHGRLDVADPQIKHYAQHIKPGAVVIDAGACIGDHTATYAKLVGPSGMVLAMEPNPLSYKALAMNFAHAPNVRTFNTALSDFAGTLCFRREENAGASHVHRDGDIEVEAGTIDSLALERLDFTHLDCEGMEPLVLMGGRAMLGKHRPVIVLEVNQKCLELNGFTETDLLATLDWLGYRWEEIEPHHGPHLPQRDIIAFPK